MHVLKTCEENTNFVTYVSRRRKNTAAKTDVIKKK